MQKEGLVWERVKKPFTSEPCSVKGGLNASARSIDPGQPAESAQAERSKSLVIGKCSACLRKAYRLIYSIARQNVL